MKRDKTQGSRLCTLAYRKKRLCYCSFLVLKTPPKKIHLNFNFHIQLRLTLEKKILKFSHFKALVKYLFFVIHIFGYIIFPLARQCTISLVILFMFIYFYKLINHVDSLNISSFECHISLSITDAKV